MSKKENRYQSELIKKLESRFPECDVILNDPSFKQGIPDILVVGPGWWGMLECKRNSNASVRPNQAYYVDRYNSMNFASFIYPENEEEVLDAMERSLSNRGKTCIPVS